MPNPVELSALQIGDVISFHLYGTTTVPNVTNGVLLGTIGGGILSGPELAAATHANIFGSLPEPKPPNDYTKYTYLIIRTSDDTRYEIGIPWIITESLTRHERAVCTIILRDFDTSKKDLLLRLLETHGFPTPEITIVG